MSLFVDSNNTIALRRRDAGVIRFVFDNDMAGVYVTFSVKENKEDSDEDAVITKSYLCGADETVHKNEAYFFIKPEDTEELDVNPSKDKLDYQDYVWMLKVETNGGLLADTVIPAKTSAFPKFRLYYGSTPDPDIENTDAVID